MDIVQGTSFRNPISIVAGDYEDAKDSDIVIITSGIARKPGQTRIELTQTNVNILKSITPQIVKEAPNALYIIVSNPVDIMTYVFTKISGLPENQIIGSGTLLDTANPAELLLQRKEQPSMRYLSLYANSAVCFFPPTIPSLPFLPLCMASTASRMLLSAH